MGTFDGSKKTYPWFIGKWFFPYCFLALVLGWFANIHVGILPFWGLVTVDWYFFNGKSVKKEGFEDAVTGPDAQKTYQTVNKVSKIGCTAGALFIVFVMVSLVILGISLIKMMG